MHGSIRRALTFNVARIDHLCTDPHDPASKLFLHCGDLGESSRKQYARPTTLQAIAAAIDVDLTAVAIAAAKTIWPQVRPTGSDSAAERPRCVYLPGFEIGCESLIGAVGNRGCSHFCSGHACECPAVYRRTRYRTCGTDCVHDRIAGDRRK